MNRKKIVLKLQMGLEVMMEASPFVIRRLILFLLVLIMYSKISFSASDKLGVGAIWGDPFGVTAKYWFENKQAINVDLGVDAIGNDDYSILCADYLWHTRSVLNKSDKGKIGLFVGAGIKYEDEKDEADFWSVRMPVGINFFMVHRPIEIFAEATPVFLFGPLKDMGIDGGLGLRIYFSDL